MDAVTIFVAHEPKTFEGANGAWTLHKFKDQNGTYFQTTKQQIANAAYALLNKTAAVTFDVEERTSGNRTFKNNVISAVVPAAEGAALTPTSNPDNGGSGYRGGGGGRGGYAPKDQAVINRSAALARAIEAVAAGIVDKDKVKTVGELTKIADAFVTYIEGPKTAPTAQGGAVSSDGGGAVAGAEAPTSAPTAAPAAAAAPAATAPGPDDDIPF